VLAPWLLSLVCFHFSEGSPWPSSMSWEGWVGPSHPLLLGAKCRFIGWLAC
jgi:hypothetical protein